MPTHLRARPSRVKRALLGIALLPLVTACSQEDDLAGSSFCDDIRSREDAFTAEGAKEIPGTLIGALREVVEDGDAPDELRDGYEQLTEASGDEELDAAVADIREVLARCGVELDE